MYYNEYDNNQPREDDVFEAPSYSVFDAPEKPKKKKNKNGKNRGIALALAVALVGGVGGGAAVSYAMNNYNGSGSTTVYQSSRTADTVNVASVDGQTELSLSELYAATIDSVVGISVEHVQSNYFGQSVAVAAAGSGFVITEDGYIVTNYHVVYNDNTGTVSDNITVTFENGDSYAAVFVGGDQDNDIAVLKIEATGLQPVVIGSSSDLSVGESIATIGNPLGELTYSLTNGIVSALDRQITTSDGNVMNMIQTNTAINPGNSGGAAFNMYGELIGITTSKYTSASDGVAAEGLGFIIPIDDVMDMLSDIIEHGYVTGQPYMGIIVSTVTSTEAQQYNLPTGALVSGVTEGSCSEQAGLQAGDIITAVNGQSISGHAELVEIKDGLAVGDTLELTVYRNGETLTIRVTLEESTPELQAKTAQLQEDLSNQQSSSSSNDYYGNDGSNSFGNGYGFPFQ